MFRAPPGAADLHVELPGDALLCVSTCAARVEAHLALVDRQDFRRDVLARERLLLSRVRLVRHGSLPMPRARRAL